METFLRLLEEASLARVAPGSTTCSSTRRRGGGSTKRASRRPSPR